MSREVMCQWPWQRYFFFQAEDGIRDYKVTGVQTCALPIFRVYLAGRDAKGLRDYAQAVADPHAAQFHKFLTPAQAKARFGATPQQLAAVTSWLDRKSTRLNSSHLVISYAVFCLKKKNMQYDNHHHVDHPKDKHHRQSDG